MNTYNGDVDTAGLVSNDFPYLENLKKLARGAAKAGVGVTQWSGEGESGQMPLSDVPVKEGLTFAEMAKSLYPEMSKVEAMNMLMFSKAACYVERDSMRFNREYGSVPSKEKFVGTLNTGIVREWLNGETKPAIEKRLEGIDEYALFEVGEDSGAVQFPYVKLEKDRGGLRKVVAPRSKLELNQKRLNAVPLFIYKELVDCIYEEAQTKLVRVYYKRTSGEERVIDTTWDEKILGEIYGKELAEEYLAASYGGEFRADGRGVELHRGYVRVPSVGESKYGGIVRSLNFSSVYKVEYKGVEANKVFVNVNIPHVPGLFMQGVERLLEGDYGKVQEMCKGLKEHGVTKEVVAPTYDGVQMWLGRSHNIEGTNFYKRLSLFMMTTPDWFPGYTGDVDKEFSKATNEETFGLV